MLKNLGKKEKIEIAIIGVGIIFLIFLLMGNTQKIRKKKMSMAKVEKSVASSLSAPITFEEPEIDESLVKEGWGRDPFSFGTSSLDIIGLDGLILNGIVWDEDNAYAIVNNDVVKIGDKLGNMTVVEITGSTVVLEQNGERHTLPLKPF